MSRKTKSDSSFNVFKSLMCALSCEDIFISHATDTRPMGLMTRYSFQPPPLASTSFPAGRAHETLRSPNELMCLAATWAYSHPVLSFTQGADVDAVSLVPTRWMASAIPLT